MGPVRSLPRHSNGSSRRGRFHRRTRCSAPQALEQRLRSLFDRVAPFTVGAEEELLLIDAADASAARPPPSTPWRSVQAIGGSRASFAARRSRR